MTINDPGKFWLFALGLIGGLLIIVVAIVMHDPASAVIGVGIVGPIIGYMTGNGRLASKGQTSQPTIAPSRRSSDKSAGRPVSSEPADPQATVSEWLG